MVQVLLFMMPLGFTIEEQSASVDVSLDVGGRNDVGHGSARKRGSIYASARRRALAAALDAALADAAVLGAD